MMSFKFLTFGLLSTTLTVAKPLARRQEVNTPKVTELYTYTAENPLFLENLVQIPDGRLLITSFDPAGSLFIVDPRDGSNSTAPSVVATLPDTTASMGIVSLGFHRYAIATGQMGELVFNPDTANIRIVQLLPNATSAELLDVIPVPNTVLLNGLTNVPTNPHILLSADSTEGRILRVDTVTKKADVAFTDDLLSAGNNTAAPLGVNGVDVRNGYLYFTNSGRGFFARVKIDEEGNKTGDVEVVAQLEGEISFGNTFDDFTLDQTTGDAYLTHHTSSIVRVKKGSNCKAEGWKQETVFGAPAANATLPAGGVVLKGPTSVVLGKGGKELFVTTSGQVNGERVGGQIVRIEL